MAKSMKSVLTVASEPVALEGVLEGARWATGNATSSDKREARRMGECGLVGQRRDAHPCNLGLHIADAQENVVSAAADRCIPEKQSRGIVAVRAAGLDDSCATIQG